MTGAGPLWNRIMLHLYERNDEAAAVRAPRGFVRAQICATTGRIARPNAATAPRSSRSGYGRGAILGRAAARARSAARRAMRVLFPHDGDVFVRNRRALAARSARTAARVARRRRRRTAALERRRHAGRIDAAGNAFWPLRLGTWRIEAHDGTQHDAVTIRVVAPPASGPGFSYYSVSTGSFEGGSRRK